MRAARCVVAVGLPSLLVGEEMVLVRRIGVPTFAADIASPGII